MAHHEAEIQVQCSALAFSVCLSEKESWDCRDSHTQVSVCKKRRLPQERDNAVHAAVTICILVARSFACEGDYLKKKMTGKAPPGHATHDTSRGKPSNSTCKSASECLAVRQKASQQELSCLVLADSLGQRLGYRDKPRPRSCG
eukprot:759457-Hanusia_phi.AAC.1